MELKEYSSERLHFSYQYIWKKNPVNIKNPLNFSNF